MELHKFPPRAGKEFSLIKNCCRSSGKGEASVGFALGVSDSWFQGPYATGS